MRKFVTGYEVLRRQPRIDGRGVFHAIATTGAVERTYVDGSVEAGENYAYRVKAWRGTDLGLWSGWANIVAPQVPAAPANLSAAAGDGTVTLSWDDADDATITGYEYRYRTGMTWNPDWTDIDPSDENTISHTLRGLTNGTEHTFEVRAINANGNGTTASVTATPVSPPSAPANLTATAGVRVRDAGVGQPERRHDKRLSGPLRPGRRKRYPGLDADRMERRCRQRFQHDRP